MTDQSVVKELVQDVITAAFRDPVNLFYLLEEALDAAEQRGYDEGYTYASNYYRGGAQDE